MTKIPKELTIAYSKEKYSMSTGSEKWIDIKSDYELEDNALIGTVANDYSLEKIDFERVGNLKKDIEFFKSKILDYHPIDELESKEKSILLQKINLGLKIYSILLDLNNN